jgi:lysozyme
MNAKRLALVFAFLGVGAGVAYWLWLYVNGDAPSLSDMKEIVQSWARRGYSAVTSIIPSFDDTDSAGNEIDPAVAKAVKIIAAFEGFSPRVYQDEGHSAIGYGHDFVPGDGFTSESVISESDGYALLESDVESRFAPVVDNAVTVELTENQKAALISFAYNVGAAAFQKSHLLQFVNAGDFDSAAAQFDIWNHAGGVVNASLTARRLSERTLFES